MSDNSNNTTGVPMYSKEVTRNNVIRIKNIRRKAREKQTQIEKNKIDNSILASSSPKTEPLKPIQRTIKNEDITQTSALQPVRKIQNINLISGTTPTTKGPRKKVLIIETGNCHFELLPSWVYYFSNCGFDVHLKSQRSGPRDIIPVLNQQGLKYKSVRNVSVSDYDVVISNTFYPHNKIDHLPGTDKKPKIKGSVVHVIKQFTDKRINSPNHVLITLANHMNDSAKKLIKRTTYLYPIFFRHIIEIPKRVLSESAKRIFMVQGTFDFGRRNYAGLIKTIKELKHRDDFIVIFMGSGGNASKIKTQLKDCGGTVKFMTGLKYDKFFDEIWKSHFVLPLVDRNSSVKGAYFKDKITSSVMMATGHIVPMLCDTKIEEIYGLKHQQNCLSYGNQAEFKQQFIKAIEMGQTEYDSLVSNVKTVHDKWIQTSKNNINKWFK